MTFLTDLATNASKQNIGVVMYSGNNDGLIAHQGTEITIQVKSSYAIPKCNFQ
jgi:carboxypeptidase D